MFYDENNNIVFENRWYQLVIDEKCISKSLIYKPTGEECLQTGEEIALFSTTQNRPYYNEIKLAYPNKFSTYQANRVRVENNRLVVGFETVPYEAIIDVNEQEAYIAFTLIDFLTHENIYDGLILTLPPVIEFRVLQLPIKNRGAFGDWLNVSKGGGIAVSILGTSEYPRIDSQKRNRYHLMYADCRKEVKLKNVGAALIVYTEDDLPDAIDRLERDFHLPLGIESRRREETHAAIYWTADISPETIDTHLEYAKKGGFRLMMLYLPRLLGGGYEVCGTYRLKPELEKDGTLKKMVAKIKACGITPGLHFLHTFIGKNTEYVTPVADSRLGLVRHFTLSRPLRTEDEIIYVNESPEGCVMAEKARILKFGGELISYENFSEQPPFCFTGCRRGAWNTLPTEHPGGEIGGILDVCEYGAHSCYIDQRTDLQDEVAEKIAKIYDLGFEFIYFDGSEGTNPPFEFNIPNAQYRVYKKLAQPPVFSMGAAKAHFNWHMLSGGNAFDVFPPEVFKQKIDQFPAEEAERLQNDYTVVNFGWWKFFDADASNGRIGTQPDMYEYGCSRAAAFDCPITLMSDLAAFSHHPRTKDILEVIRRWENVRLTNRFSQAQKDALKQLGAEHEHILLINENKEYELLPYWQIAFSDERKNQFLRAFLFERNGSTYVVYWHPTGSGNMLLPIPAEKIDVFEELYLTSLPKQTRKEGVVLPVGDRRYVKIKDTPEAVMRAFDAAVLLP